MGPSPALTVFPPLVPPIPLVCDSPHSGTAYPDDFGTCRPVSALRQAEDTHVEALWRSAPAHGATLIAAHFPRSYIDANRALDDLDPDLLDSPWPAPLNPGEKTRLGFGLVWRQLGPGEPLYERKLTVAEVQARIARCWQPYQDAVDAAVQAALAQHGFVWHLNLHSMPQKAHERLGGDASAPLADFVLGDRDGSSCEPAMVDVVEASLQSHGYSVARNKPYKGAALVARIGDPARHRHSLQVEIRRPLYMDEATRAPNAGFERLQRCLDDTLAALAVHIRRSIPARCG